ncbi:BEN domain-containing protein 6 isoform X2 [Symphalangus syndactylus]|uniref:BEN domain-containing protein 6 isoform X2 n=1 Tax=Symphalangus syndactylus TaxID=9590 RepID=UPI003003CD08
MQKILQTDEITNTQAFRKGKRKRTETMDSENANSDMDKGQRDPYSGNAFLPGESSSEDEEPLAELSKEELCAKIKSLKEKLTNTRKENSRLRQSLVMLQGVTKQLFPNTDDVSIRRMIGQKLNNCTKKPNLSKNLNSQDIK